MNEGVQVTQVNETQVEGLIEEAIAEDQAIYRAAGINVVTRCYQCRDEFDLDVPRRRPRNRLGFVFCSEACRREWRAANKRACEPTSESNPR